MLFFLCVYTSSYSQGINPYEGLESAEESIDWFYTGNSSSGYQIFKIGKVVKDSGYGASATTRVRVSVMTKVDVPCTYGDFLIN